MIDLYAAGTSNGMRARIALEECGLAYQLHPIDIQKGEQKSPGFLAMNPMGQIPVLVDSEGPGGKPLTLSQSTAILVYCAEKSGRFLPRDPAARAATLQALMSASTDITPMLGALFAVIRSKHPHGPTAGVGRLSRPAQVLCGRRADDRGPVALRGLRARERRGTGDLRRPAEPGALGEGVGRATGHSAGHQVLSAEQGLS